MRLVACTVAARVVATRLGQRVEHQSLLSPYYRAAQVSAFHSLASAVTEALRMTDTGRGDGGKSGAGRASSTPGEGDCFPEQPDSGDGSDAGRVVVVHTASDRALANFTAIAARSHSFSTAYTSNTRSDNDNCALPGCPNRSQTVRARRMSAPHVA